MNQEEFDEKMRPLILQQEKARTAIQEIKLDHHKSMMRRETKISNLKIKVEEARLESITIGPEEYKKTQEAIRTYFNLMTIEKIGPRI